MGMTITKGKQQDLSNFPIERMRLQILIPGHLISIVGLVLFGWTLKFGTHIVGPEVALFVMGFGVTTAFNITNGLLIDLHRDQPAAVNFTTCLMSAGRGGGDYTHVPWYESGLGFCVYRFHIRGPVGRCGVGDEGRDEVETGVGREEETSKGGKRKRGKHLRCQCTFAAQKRLHT